MSRQRVFLSVSLLVTALVLLVLAPTFRRVRVPVPAVQTVVLDPYDQAILADYGRYRDALLEDDVAALEVLAEEAEGYLQLRTLFTLGRHEALSAAERLGYLERAMALRLDDPLADLETEALLLELARTAEAAGRTDRALEAYIELLPDEEAVRKVKEMVTDPYDLSNIFLQAGMDKEALEALDGRAAPSIEAPAHRGLWEYEKALDAYNRWLAEVPGSPDALYGRAWMLLYLGYNDQADAAFAELSGPSALYGRGIIARREGKVDQAVHFFRRTGDPQHLWYATDLLEAEERSRDAIPIYLELAKTDSRLSDDAAYRAMVLARRHGLSELAAQARALLPAHSYLGLVAGKELELPQSSTLPEAKPPVLELAQALARVHDVEAAIGELEFALREAETEAATIAIAEALQRLGEYRQSQQAAEAWLNAGSQDLRTWQLAYPRAYPEIVVRAASRRGIKPILVWAVMRQESRFYPKAVSWAGAKGLMQFMPSTWDWMAELQGEPPGDPFDPEDSIRYGAHYLSWLMDYFDGDIERAVPSYNGGQGYIRRLYDAPPINGNKTEFYRFIDKPETRDFLQKVMFNYEVYKALYAERLADRSQ